MTAQPVTPTPSATPQQQVSQADGSAILNQYAESLKRRGIGSTVRSTGGAMGLADTSGANQGMAAAGTASTLGGSV